MTKAEWQGLDSPHSLLTFIGHGLSNRKLRLFAVACCRAIWDKVRDARSQKAVELAERHADGQATTDEVLAARTDAEAAWAAMTKAGEATEAVWETVWEAECTTMEAVTAVSRVAGLSAWASLEVEPNAMLEAWVTEAEKEAQKKQAIILRCISGNHYRPAPLPAAWRTHTALALATAAYENRILPAGTLDTFCLAVLADALEDAGCDDTDMLAHCRQPGEHVRGCWVVDLILGKE